MEELTSLDVDSYYPVSPDLVLLIVSLKNVFGFAFSFCGLTVLGTAQWPGLSMYVILLGPPLCYFRKRIRYMAASWKFILDSNTLRAVYLVDLNSKMN